MTFGQVSVGHTAPVLIVASANAYPYSTGGSQGSGVLLNNNGHTVYLGDSTVTSSTGFPLSSSATAAQLLSLQVSEPLYAICGGTDTTVLSYLAT